MEFPNGLGRAEFVHQEHVRNLADAFGEYLGSAADRVSGREARGEEDHPARVASAGDPVRLKIATPVWNPSRALGTGDDRDLGVMVDRVAVR